MPRKKWDIGDVFMIRRNDGKFILGQVVGQEQQAMNSVTISVYAIPCDSEEDARSQTLTPGTLIAVIFSTRDLLDRGLWKIVDNRPVMLPVGLYPYENLRGSGFVGAKIYGSANVEKLANAYYGLEAWDGFFDPDYLDKMLISPARKPATVLLSKGHA